LLHRRPEWYAWEHITRPFVSFSIEEEHYDRQ